MLPTVLKSFMYVKLSYSDVQVLPGKPRRRHRCPQHWLLHSCLPRLWLLYEDVELCWLFFFFSQNPGKAAILVALCASSDHGLSGGAASFFS